MSFAGLAYPLCSVSQRSIQLQTMKSEMLRRLQPENRDRNQKIASILALLITFAAKIEKLKEKLCGFSSNQFSPQQVFQALDLTSKGYLDLFDVKEFLSNDRIQQEDILKLFVRFGSTPSQARLTYHGYLQLLKPYFSLELGRDLLLRDTLRKSISLDAKSLRQTHEAVLLLLNQLILMNCICISQHESIKATLMEEYILNELQLIEILGLSQSRRPLRAIYEFIDCNSQYEVDEAEVKFLLAYLRVSESQLSEEPIVASLFLPTRISLPQEATQKQGLTRAMPDKELELMRMNYDRKYIGKNDLLSSTQKMSFLNYVHPNSYKPPENPPKAKNQDRKKVTEAYQPSERIGSEHPILEVYNDQKMKDSLNNFKRMDKAPPTQRIYESQVQPSNVYSSRSQVQLLNPSQMPIHTPVLEQFMHQRNLRTNMGQYKPQKQNELNVLLEESVQSHLSESEAFERVPAYSANTLNVPNRHGKAQRAGNAGYFRQQEVRMDRKQQMEISGKMGTSDGPGLLDQFLRQDLG